MLNAATHAGLVPPPDVIARARVYVEALGLQKAARNLGVGREGLARVVAGLRVRRGSLLLVARGLGMPESDCLSVAQASAK